MTPERLRELLAAVASGQLPVDTALERLRTLPFEDLGDSLVDHHRPLRQQLAETIYGEGKTARQIAPIIHAITHQGSNVLVTRLDATKAASLGAEFPGSHYEPLSRTLQVTPQPIPQRPGRILVACAGTSDLAVAREASITARFHGWTVEELTDVGVAGLHRLLAHGPQLHAADVLIVVAGMEGALPSVIGGLVATPVIAVPTSVGYGAAFGGLAALAGMLNSCASGVTVVNIDNGFGAAIAAARILLSRNPS